MYAAADDDDDDLFAEFDVDMDMDGEPAPPAKPSMSIAEEADDMHMDVDRDTTTPAADAIPEDTSLSINTRLMTKRCQVSVMMLPCWTYLTSFLSQARFYCHICSCSQGSAN